MKLTQLKHYIFLQHILCNLIDLQRLNIIQVGLIKNNNKNNNKNKDIE